MGNHTNELFPNLSKIGPRSLIFGPVMVRSLTQQGSKSHTATSIVS